MVLICKRKTVTFNVIFDEMRLVQEGCGVDKYFSGPEAAEFMGQL